MKHNFKVGDRIAVYSRRKHIGTISNIKEDEVCVYLGENEHVVLANYKQCRKLKPKRAPADLVEELVDPPKKIKLRAYLDYDEQNLGVIKYIQNDSDVPIWFKRAPQFDIEI